MAGAAPSATAAGTMAKLFTSTSYSTLNGCFVNYLIADATSATVPALQNTPTVLSTTTNLLVGTVTTPALALSVTLAWFPTGTAVNT